MCREGGTVLTSFGSPTLLPLRRSDAGNQGGRRRLLETAGAGTAADRAIGGEQPSDAGPSVIDRRERASLDVLAARFECLSDDADYGIREHVFMDGAGKLQLSPHASGVGNQHQGLLASFAGAHAHEQGLSRRHLSGNRRSQRAPPDLAHCESFRTS